MDFLSKITIYLIVHAFTSVGVNVAIATMSNSPKITEDCFILRISWEFTYFMKMVDLLNNEICARDVPFICVSSRGISVQIKSCEFNFIMKFC